MVMDPKTGALDFELPFRSRTYESVNGACPVVADGAVLLTRRSINPGRGLWTFPGGFVDFGESVTDAAVRETFEESGVLLAHPEGEAAPVALDNPKVADRVAGLRDALNKGERTFLDIVRSERLRLVLDDVHYVGRWITPVGPPRRPGR